MSNQVVYHGSADLIERIEPRKNIRFANEKIIWDAVSFHATPYRWIALAYTRAKGVPETTGVDLYELNPVVDVFGPATLEEALTSLYGKGGYLYEFNASDFSHAEGLGNLEVFTGKSVEPIQITRIEDPVAEMRAEGVEFRFERRRDPKAL
jgi:hypothetical protein